MLKKTSLSGYILTSTFNTKSTELENKIKDGVTKANTVKSDLNDYAKKTDVANDITTIKSDYVTNASLTSKLNDLKSQHIATEVKTIDDKTKKNASDILGFESRLKQKEDIVDEVQRENALTSGRDYYLDKMYLLYECIHLNTLIIKLIYGNQMGLIIIQVIQIWMLYLKGRRTYQV